MAGPAFKEHTRTLRDLTRSRLKLNELSDRTASHRVSLDALAAENQMLRQQVADLQNALQDNVKELRESIEASFGRTVREMVQLHEVTDAQRRSYVEMTRQMTQVPDARLESAKLPLEEDPFLDIFYREFEDRYRGSREEILTRLREHSGHVSFLKNADDKKPRIIDLGCGRGEWLEVLREEGLEAVGVDTNEAQAEAARSLDLVVEIDDAISYLSKQKDRTVDFISAFHLIEHLEFPLLTRLLKDCLRVMKPGGKLLLETPNPQSLIVGAYKFWFDPTHVRPYPPELIGQLLESLGFREVEILPLHPDGRNFEYKQLHGVAEPVADLIAGPLDYAVLCRRP